MTKITKYERAQLFRHRLSIAMAEAGFSQARLAREINVDRSTLSQLRTDEGSRLPNGQIVAELASALGVSSDWLLGLTDRPERATELIAGALSLTDAQRALVDQTVYDWHRQAEGLKIRHVPATLPDMLKTDRVLNWEYAATLGKSAERAIETSRERLDWMLSAQSDFEIAMPLHEMQSFIAAEGYYRGLSLEARQEQLEIIRKLYQALYPRLRIFLFDAKKIFASPLTIFGQQHAALYIGQNYLVIQDRDRVAQLIAHFDLLIRETKVSSHGFADWLADEMATHGIPS